MEKVILGRASPMKWKNTMRLGGYGGFRKCSAEMGTGDRANEEIRRWPDHEGQGKNLEFELELSSVVEPLKTCPLTMHIYTQSFLERQ